MAVVQPRGRRYQPGERVALFLPCYCDVFFPDVGKAMIALFERLSIPLEYPVEQTCCGQPAFNAGHWDEAASLARRFAQVFADYPWIVVPSGSCAAMARAYFADLKADGQVAEAGSRVHDLATFLVSELGRTDVGARYEARVTYHDGCHGRRELRATNAAVELLQAVRGVDYVELPKIDECCGFGGTFAVSYPELSVSMGAAKIRAIEDTRADVVTSLDSSCLMHLAGIARKQAGPKLRFVHLAEILASS